MPVMPDAARRSCPPRSLPPRPFALLAGRHPLRREAALLRAARRARRLARPWLAREEGEARAKPLERGGAILELAAALRRGHRDASTPVDEPDAARGLVAV